MTAPLVGPKAWSASAVNRYLACPQAFKFQYVDKVPRAEEIPLHWRLGTIVHKALEVVAQRVKDTKAHGPWMSDENWALAKKALAEAWIEEDMPKPEQSDGLWDRAHVMVEKTLEDQQIGWEHIVAPEQKIYLRGDGAAIIGYIDLLLRPDKDTAHVRDYKTRSQTTPPDMLGRDKQLRLYAALVRRKYPWAQRVLVSHYYPPIAEEVIVEVPEEDSEEAYWELLAVKDMVQSETEWPTNKGSECLKCAYQNICPAWVEEPDPEQEALKAMARF